MKRNGLNDIKAGAKPVTSQNVAMPAKNTGISVGQENRSTVSKDAFLQPAQRPPKGLVPAASMNNIKSVAQDLIPKPLSKPTKRNAPIAVYNDNQSDKDTSSKQLKEARPTTQQSAASVEYFDAPMYPGDEGWVNVESQQSSSERHLRGLHNATSEATQPLTHQVEDDIPGALYLDAVEDLPNDRYPVTGADKSENWDPIPGAWETGLSRSITSEEGQTVEIKPADLQAPRLSSVPIDDQADLSDYEDDEYDEQGYATAHSVRENTTGGVTTVLVPPKLTKRGAAEIATAREMVESRRAATDPDDDEIWDISMVIEYGDEIFQYMREVESELMPNPHYMDIQTELKWSMRSVLIDWVVQVHTRFGLLPETLFLAVNFIDRFLSLKIVSLNKLQLVGATALLLAAKYEEINCPSVQEIVYMVDGGYTIQEVIKAERFMLCMLNFNLGWPGPMSFMRRISKADDYDNEIRTVAKYFLEVGIMDERFVGSPPSYMAAGAQCLSRMILEKGEWTLDHVYYSGYTYAQLKPLIATLLDCCRIARKHHSAVFDKYSLKQFKRAATYVEGQIMQGYCLPFEQNVRYHLPEFYDGYAEPNSIAMPIPIMG
ncbi:cyclin-like protein [Hypoxylon sp. FL1150]|nr:cyclin-like protein [Hypoxylon sp. FL1150]